jgi:hypothetical protein
MACRAELLLLRLLEQLLVPPMDRMTIHARQAKGDPAAGQMFAACLSFAVITGYSGRLQRVAADRIVRWLCGIAHNARTDTITLGIATFDIPPLRQGC